MHIPQSHLPNFLYLEFEYEITVTRN